MRHLFVPITNGGHASSDDAWMNDGNDTIRTSAVAASVDGGLGRDPMEGGAGGERFVDTAIAESQVGTLNRDAILDFRPVNADAIDLSAPASAPSWPGASFPGRPFPHAAHLPRRAVAS